MKLNICMLLQPDFKPNMVIWPAEGICSYLSNFGHGVTWVIWAEEGWQVKSFYFNDVRVYATPRAKYLPEFSLVTEIVNYIPNILRRMRLILKIFREGSYNLIFVRGFVFDVLAAAYIRRRYEIPFVFVLSNPLEQGWEEYKIDPRGPLFLHYLVTKFNKFVVTHLLHEADLILPQSKWLKQQLVGQGIPESKMVTYPNGVDINSFSNANAERVRMEYHLHGSEIILYVGIMGKARYLAVLIEAFVKVKRERKNVKLVMVGDGSDEGRLRRLATELGIGDGVIFTGRVPQSEVPDFIAAADIGVSPVPPLPFYQLSSPIKLFEYMAMAKPVVASEEIPEHKMVLQQSDGGILAPFTPEAFANAIIELLDNPEKAAEMGQKGREWVMKNRSYEILARQLEERLLELLETPD